MLDGKDCLIENHQWKTFSLSKKFPEKFQINDYKELLEVKVCGQDCCCHQIKSSFFVSMLFTRQNYVGAFASLPANMRKIESHALVQTNDDNENF